MCRYHYQDFKKRFSRFPQKRPKLARKSRKLLFVTKGNVDVVTKVEQKHIVYKYIVKYGSKANLSNKCDFSELIENCKLLRIQNSRPKRKQSGLEYEKFPKSRQPTREKPYSFSIMLPFVLYNDDVKLNNRCTGLC